MDLCDLGDGTGGMWTRQQALALVTPGQVRGHVLDGVWRTTWPGVLCDGGFALDHVSWAWAAVLASLPRGSTVPRLDVVVCARSAARVLGIPLIDDDDPATGARDHVHHDIAVRRHVRDLVSRPVNPAEPVQHLHRRQLALESEDLLVVDGLLVTGHLRTLVDLAGVVSHEALVCAMDWCLHHEHVTVAELEAAVDRRKGCEHAPALARAVELADGRAESCLETLTRLLLLPELPGLRPQVVVADEWGTVVARLDLADEELRLAVESDGKKGHTGELSVAKDRRRDRLTGDRFGWWTERVTWYEARRLQRATVARVVARADVLRRKQAAREARPAA